MTDKPEYTDLITGKALEPWAQQMMDRTESPVPEQGVPRHQFHAFAVAMLAEVEKAGGSMFDALHIAAQAGVNASSSPDAAGSGGEVERLMHVIDRDRYVVAHCVGAIKEAIKGRAWLLEGRGPFEWDDDDYRKEFGGALTAIEEAAAPLAIVGWDKSDCTRIEERVNAARLAARELLAKPHGHREMILADIYPAPDATQTREAELAGFLEQVLLYADPSGDGLYDGAGDIAGVKQAARSF